MRRPPDTHSSGGSRGLLAPPTKLWLRHVLAMAGLQLSWHVCIAGVSNPVLLNSQDGHAAGQLQPDQLQRIMSHSRAVPDEALDSPCTLAGTCTAM